MHRYKPTSNQDPGDVVHLFEQWPKRSTSIRKIPIVLKKNMEAVLSQIKQRSGNLFEAASIFHGYI